MPQPLLPLVPDGATPVSHFISVVRENGQWTWLAGILPIFSHRQEDRDSFRMFTAQLVCNGTCKQAEIVKTFGVAPISVQRAVKQFREQGSESFYQPRRGRGATVMTEQVIQQAQDLLHQGCSRKEAAQRLKIKADTLRKAIQQGKLGGRSTAPTDQASPTPPTNHQEASRREASDKSQRGVQDAAAIEGLGVACTRLVERVSAAIGLLPGGAPVQYENCRDVTFGGVLCALPALEQNGLFRHLESCFQRLGGYYTTVQVFSLLGFMALCRIKTVEQLQFHPPGELGKLLGLDRVPEVRCLRNKLTALTAGQAPENGTDGFPAPKREVVNPARRELDKRRRTLQGRLTRKRAEYAALAMHPEADEKKIAPWRQRQADLVESIEHLEHELSEVKQLQSQTPTHLSWEALPKESQFQQLAPSRKRLLDTVKMIAYRAETAMVGIVRESLRRADDARVLIQDLYRQDADLMLDEANQRLEVRVHPFSNPRWNRAIADLLEHLNAAQMTCPGTKLTLAYSLLGLDNVKQGSSIFPRGQES